jgi:hypothetical protein
MYEADYDVSVLSLFFFKKLNWDWYDKENPKTRII